jgi:hypothetical protein
MSVVPSAGAGGACSSRHLPGLGVLTCEIPPGLVDEAIEAAGCREQRVRLLPARAVVYFVLGMCLLSGEDSTGPPGYRAVMRSLTHGLRQAGQAAAVPSASALCRARQRLGSKPFEMLFDRLRGPVAAAGTAGAAAFGLLTVAWDATGIDVPATAANIAAFGRVAGGGPQLRVMTLIECGTHAIIDAALDGFAKVSEQVLARRLLAALRPGMLLLADRNFPGGQLWGLAAATGAHLLWRARSDLLFTPLEHLPDGSYLSVLPTPGEAHRGWISRQRGHPVPRAGHRVRIIGYTVTVTTAAATRTEAFRLVTTLLDPQQAPAAELAVLYHQRWESETGYAELKTRLRGAGFTLRSRGPELACQEMWALLAACHALSAMKYQAAGQAGIDPDRISFTATLRTARDHARTQQHTRTPDGLARARATAIAGLLADLLPRRRDRCYTREKKTPRNWYPARKTGQPRPPGKATYRVQIITWTPQEPTPP